jgi:hypothetical protein
LIKKGGIYMKKILTLVASLLMFGLLVNTASAITVSTYDGINFPAGAASFADELVSANLLGGASNGNPDSALGAPDRSSVSLGAQGWIILKFTDNSLCTSGDSSPDLYVKEGGSSKTEMAEIYISEDGTNWIKVGDANRKTLFDIDSISGVVQGAKYSFVKCVDLNGKPTTMSWEGADIDSVGAISSVNSFNENNGGSSEIPEFPTTVIPMAAIIGLAFLFGRRK